MKRATQEKSVRDLEHEHKTLDIQIQRLERRAYLTPDEQRRATELKKQKLAKKDRIFSLRRGD